MVRCRNNFMDRPAKDVDVSLSCCSLSAQLIFYTDFFTQRPMPCYSVWSIITSHILFTKPVSYTSMIYHYYFKKLSQVALAWVCVHL